MNDFRPRYSNRLKDAWVDFVSNCIPGQKLFAVTLNFNPVTHGWSGPVFRINESGDKFAVHPGRKTSADPSSLKNYRPIPMATVRDRIYDLWGKIDRLLFGRRFHRSKIRSSYRGFIEHPDSNIHAHLAWNVPDEFAPIFPEAVPEKWGFLVPGGTVDIQPVSDPATWGRYCVKAQSFSIEPRVDAFLESERRN
jgi:hypothetical protein